MEPVLLEDLVVINSIPCRIWMHPDDNSVFKTIRDRYFYANAAEYGFYPYYEPPVPKVFFAPVTCPKCGAVVKAEMNPRDIDAYYSIFCRECGEKLIAKTRYTAVKTQDIKNEREAIPHPDKSTPLMQILGKNPSDAEARINYFVNPGNRFGFPENAKIDGAVYRQEECRELLRYPEDYYNLWFSSFPHEFRELHMTDTSQPVFIIRFKSGQNDKLIIPYSYEFGGEYASTATYDGSGFIRVPGGKIPMYQYVDRAKISGGLISKINCDGSETNIASFNIFTRKFILF